MVHRVGAVSCVYKAPFHAQRPKLYVPPPTTTARVIRGNDDGLVMSAWNAVDSGMSKAVKTVLAIISIIVLFWLMSVLADCFK